MSDIKISTQTAVTNLRKFVNKPLFALKSPYIKSFVKQVCDQIHYNKYEQTDYLKKFSKIRLTQCNEFLFVFIYKVFEAFLGLKRNDENRSQITFSGNQPAKIILPNKDESIPEATVKLKVLETVMKSARIKNTWKESMEKFKNILKNEDNVDIEINENNLIKDTTDEK